MNIPKRIASALINSLKGGVVPRVGLPYITVGRKEEIEALVHDIDIVSQGGASFRFIAGRYGSGKSFLLQTVRNYAMDRGFAVMAQRGRGLPPTASLCATFPPKPAPTAARSRLYWSAG